MTNAQARLGCVLGLLGVTIASGCGGDRGDGDSRGGTWSPSSGSGSGGEASGGDGDAGGASQGESGGSGDSEGSGGASGSGATDGSIRLDVGDTGGMDSGGEGGGTYRCEDVVDTTSNLGCEFWAVDLPNSWGPFRQGGGTPADQQYAVVVANTTPETATVDVFLGAAGMPVDTAAVPPGETHRFELPAQNIAETEISTDGTAYRIESTVPITAYQFNPLDNVGEIFSNDASLLFPTHVYGTDYVAVTADSLYHNYLDPQFGFPQTENAGAFVSVVANEDGTTVDAYPTSALYPGATTGVVLNRGQVFTVVSQGPNQFPTPEGGGNLSGTRVVADKPVAVFSGNVMSLEPSSATCCGDHTEHQMIPLTAWGTEYVAAPPPPPQGNRSLMGYRVTGGFDGTTLAYSPAAPPGAPATIDAYETVRFQTDQAFAVVSADDDKPFALTQFLLSNAEYGGNGGEDPGDPGMILLPAVAQFQNLYTFLAPAGYDVQYLTVVAPVGTAVMLDGAPLNGETSPAGTAGGIAYEAITAPISDGAHTVESPDAPVGITVVGYALWVSYGYPGGSGVEVISIPPPPPG